MKSLSIPNGQFAILFETGLMFGVRRVFRGSQRLKDSMPYVALPLQQPDFNFVGGNRGLPDAGAFGLRSRSNLESAVGVLDGLPSSRSFLQFGPVLDGSRRS